jgi:hypothetical protein
MILPVNKIENIYSDNRSNHYTLKKIKNNIYKVIEDDFEVKYVPESDQYLINKDTFWNPVNGDAFTHIDKTNYTSMQGTSFIYCYAHYLPVPPLNKVSIELRKFLTDVWERKFEATSGKPKKETMGWIYTFIYLKKNQNTKKLLEENQNLLIINKLVSFSEDKPAKIQIGWAIPPENKKEDDIQKLYTMMNNENKDISNSAYRALNRGYYYYTINKELIHPEKRIILNIAPNEMLATIKKLWPIVKHSKIVSSMKFSGPYSAAKKNDSILIYAMNGNDSELNNLLTDIQNIAITTENLLPNMITEVDKGIGLADEPKVGKEKQISFGMKRVILAFMALSKATTLDEMITIGTTYFQQTGINVENPASETGIEPNPEIQFEMEMLAQLWNA